MRTAGILFAIFKKNNTQPGLFGALLLVGVTIVAIFIDAIHPAPPAAAVIALLWLGVFGAAGGAGAFSADSKASSTQFLEYLPIRRWQIWLGNWGDGVFWTVGTALLLVSLRTIRWAPPSADVPDSADPLSDLVMRSRWTLFIAFGTITFCAYSVSSFYRTIFERDTAAILRGVVGAFSVAGAVLILPIVLEVFPSFGEVAAPLAVLGAMFSLVGLLMFVLMPREWGPFRLWLLRSACLLVVYALTGGILYAACKKWARFDAQSVRSVYIASASADPTASIYVTVATSRSGEHLFRVDPNAADGAPVYLGRGLTPFADNSGAAVMLDGRLLCIWRYARPPTWRGRQEMLATIDTSASESPELLFPAQEFIDADGARYQRGQMQLTPNGRAFVFCTYPRDGNRRGGGNQLCVADRSGRIAHRAAINQSADFFMGADGRVIVCNSPSHEESQPAESFLIIDPRTGRQESLQLPGSVLAIAPDLSCAVCLSHKPAGAQVERSLSLTDLRSHETRTMVASNLMPSIRAKDFSPYWGSRLAQIGQTMSIEDLQFCTDRDCTRAAWLVRAGEPPGGSGIMLTDLQTASTRPVLNKADIPESAERGSNPSLTLLGFSRDGQSIAFESEQGVHRIDLAGGTVTLVARKSHDADYVNWQVASDHKRVIATYFRHDDAPARRRQRADLPQIIELWDQGRCTRLRESSDPSAARWIGDRYVALATSRRIVLFDSNSNESRTILDAGTLRAN